MLELRPNHPLDCLLKAAALPRSTFYYQVKALQAKDKHARVKEQILRVFDRHKGRYGYRRVTCALRNMGQHINHKTVQRLMGHLQLKSLVRPKKYRAYQGELGRIAPNILQRKFKADHPNQKWVTDVTEFAVGGKKLYLSPVMDLYNSEIISYEMAERPLFPMVAKMMKKALARLKPHEQPVVHSDQGWQYQMSPYQRLLSDNAVTQSMSRSGNCFDNAAMESFFGTLKAEFFHLSSFKDINELRTGLKQYIRYYNHHRIKVGLGGLSPVQYRAQAA